MCLITSPNYSTCIQSCLSVCLSVKQACCNLADVTGKRQAHVCPYHKLSHPVIRLQHVDHLAVQEQHFSGAMLQFGGAGHRIHLHVARTAALYVQQPCIEQPVFGTVGPH